MPCTIIGAFTHSPRLHCMHYVPCSRGLTVCIGALTHMLTQTYAHRACKHQAPHIVFYIPCMCPCAMQPSPSDPIHCIYYYYRATVSIRMQQKTAPSTPLHALLALHPMQQRPRRLHRRLQHMLTQTRARRTRKHHVSYTVSRACAHPCLPCSPSLLCSRCRIMPKHRRPHNLYHHCHQASAAELSSGITAACCLVPLPPRIPAAFSLI